MKYTELKEIIMNWSEEQKETTHFLLAKGEVLDEIIDTIDYLNFRTYENLEDFILSSIEETQDKIPNWICIDVVRTYKTALRFEDNLFFMSDLPRWAEGGAEYGTEEEKKKYQEGIKYLCEYSRVLEIYR